jgi:hypothetical protein
MSTRVNCPAIKSGGSGHLSRYIRAPLHGEGFQNAETDALCAPGQAPPTSGCLGVAEERASVFVE